MKVKIRLSLRNMISCKHVFLFVLLLHDFAFVLAMSDANCDKRITCGECLAHPECFWCKDKMDNVEMRQRCYSKFQEAPCSQENQENPSSSHEVLEGLDLNPDSREEIIQISPQRVKVKLRPQSIQGHRLNFKIALSKEYPLDLYFLLDLSWSMKTSRDNVAEQGEEIINGIKEITQDLHTGFGSFVDKNVPPFTSAISSVNCDKNNPNCPPPYSFYHKTTLQNLEAEQFKEEVLDSPLAGNVDEPEGSLDALMQAMVCWDRVGWRSDARKIILLATNMEFHYAMDGKIVGILDRHDGRCHLNGTHPNPGYYTHSVWQDYPSISHIKAVAERDSFVLIFAVTPQYLNIWTSLSDQIRGSFVETLDTDAQNIVNIINERYKEITSSIKVTVDNGHPDVSVVLKSKCADDDADETATDHCDNIDIGTTVDFVAEIRARRCLQDPVTLSISPVGLNQSMLVEVETLCQCDCELSQSEGSDEVCNDRGKNKCGVCVCDEGFIGQTCDCEINAVSSNPNDPKANCKDPNSPEAVCNGVGSCQCGVCVCNDPSKNYGKYCECDDSTCIRDSLNQLCSGHGNCVCGDCTCNPGWSGRDCSCEEDTVKCLSPYNERACSENGECKCNRCNCNSVQEGLYSGKYCEKAPSELNPCKILQGCVECLAFQSGPDLQEEPAKTCHPNCLRHHYTEHSSQNLTAILQGDVKPCEARNEDDCKFRFVSQLLAENEVQIFLLLNEDGEKEDCPMATAALSLSVLSAAIILLGLAAFLAYKCYWVIEDKRSYARFEENRKKKMATNENNLYRSPITTYQNPMHGKAIN